MAIDYPSEGIDTFNTPSEPEGTPLSEAGSSTRNHDENHEDLGLAVMALETNATPIAHDHSGDDPSGLALWPTQRLQQANTHQNPDTDQALASIHHTIGPTGTQAAAGNHTHDYEGNTITDKPLVICTSTTRPIDPPLGMTIIETDTNCWRQWAAFPNNTYTPPIAGPTLSFAYLFNTANVKYYLDPLYFAQYYVVGNPSTQYAAGDGALGASPRTGAQWYKDLYFPCRVICPASVTDFSFFATDNQEMTWESGGGMTGFYLLDQILNVTSPSNDMYLRLSADQQSYVRFAVFNDGAGIFVTTAGVDNEVALGWTNLPSGAVQQPAASWTAKCIGNQYIFYYNGSQILVVVDQDNSAHIGPDYRGWGIGMGSDGWFQPNSVVSITVQDMPYFKTGDYTTVLRWQLLPIGVKPHIRAETHVTQEVIPIFRSTCWFDTLLEDLFGFCGRGSITYQTTVDEVSTLTVSEPGHYSIHASIPWDPNYAGFDFSSVGIQVNHQDIGRNNWEFVRGQGYAPDKAQTNEIFASWYFAAGDTLTLTAEHNSVSSCYTWYSPTPPNAQMVYLELDFLGP
jgi:hypothetical protein